MGTIASYIFVGTMGPLVQTTSMFMWVAVGWKGMCCLKKGHTISFQFEVVQISCEIIIVECYLLIYVSIKICVLNKVDMSLGNIDGQSLC